jgi:hypothetical protein
MRLPADADIVRRTFYVAANNMATSADFDVIEVDIYTAHEGDIDLYQCRGSPQMAILGDSWRTIEDLRRRLFLVAVGRASATFASSVEADLQAWTLDEDTRRRIRAIVESDVEAGVAILNRFPASGRSSGPATGRDESQN